MSLSGRKVVVLGVSALLVAIASACSQQGEGERCDREAAGDSDCESPLVCTDFTPNMAAPNKIERCCPPAGIAVTDERCERSSIVESGGTAGTAGSAGQSTEQGGAGAGGSAE